MSILVLPVEVKAREFIPKLFLISRALRRGICCFIGDKVAVNRFIRYFKNNIYFHKSINKNDINYIKELKLKVDKYVALDEEANYSITDNSQFTKLLDYRSSIENVKNVDRIYNWGTFDHHLWKKKYKIFSKKFKITGNPRFDILKKNIYSLIFKKEILELKKKYKNFIFIPSSFISSKKKLEKIIKFEKKRINDEKYLKQRISARLFEHKLFLEFYKLIVNLSNYYPKFNIVIKPHPTENAFDWHNKIKNLKNVHIDINYDLVAYIAASEFVIFNSSTAGIYSLIMRKKTICYSSLSDKKSLRSYPNRFGILCKSFKDIKRVFKYSYNGIYKKQLNLLKKRLCIKKRSSSDLIIDDLVYNFEQKKNNNINLLLFRFLSLLFHIKSFITNKIILFKNDKIDINLPMRSMKQKLGTGINKKEIFSFLDKIKIKEAKVLGFGKNGFLIYR